MGRDGKWGVGDVSMVGGTVGREAGGVGEMVHRWGRQEGWVRWNIGGVGRIVQ